VVKRAAWGYNCYLDGRFESFSPLLLIFCHETFAISSAPLEGPTSGARLCDACQHGVQVEWYIVACRDVWMCGLEISAMGDTWKEV
jgi:hypothetical protein